MALIVRDFNGKLNLDQHASRVPAGDFVDAQNITRDAQNASSDSVVSNVVGNQLVSYTYQPDTINVCIGAYSDPLKNRTIEFIWNNQGYHSILNYNNITRTRTKILESRTDSNDIDILNFQLLYKVNSISVIHRDEGDLLFFNDAYNPPGAFNIARITSGILGPVTEEMIRLAKQPPLNALLPVYGDDLTSNVNNLKKKLFQFIYRWVYKDGYKSIWAPISKCVLPTDAYNSMVESNPQKNNKITLTVTGGPADYQKVEIAGRMSLGDDFGDFFLIDSLDRIDYNIPSGTTYDYVFLNDGQYTFLDPLETELIYSFVPDKANCTALVNGNVLVFGGITEGYPFIERNQINVQITADYAETASSGGSSGNPTITYNISSVFPNTCPPFGPGMFPQRRTYMEITIGPIVTVGDAYRIKFDVLVIDPDANVDVTYVAILGDTPTTVAQALRTLVDAQTGSGLTPTFVAPDKIRIQCNFCFPNGTQVFQNVIITATAATPIFGAGGSATWKWNAKYRLGLIYFDKYGKTNGVVSFVSNSALDPTDFSVTTGDFTINPVTFNPRIPIINASINHLPPSWAVSYQWVRTENQSISYFIDLVTVQVDSDVDYYYFSLEQLDKYKEINTGFVPAYTFQEGDRLRILTSVDEPNQRYNVPSASIYDFEILGTVERTLGSGNGSFLKIKTVSGVTFPNDFYLIEIYRPALRTLETSTPFFTFGESYPIYTDPSDNIRYHAGPIQSQTAMQPATFQFDDGDVYYKFRPEYRTTAFTTFMILGMMDANYADFWASSVNSNGNPFVIDPNAATVYNPVLVRFGQAYQPGTNINGLNTFYPANYDEYFRDYGDIMAFSIRDKLLRVYQKLQTGRVPIFGQIIKDQTGTDQLVVSDKLLNPIQYYEGQFGIGDHPESLASNNYADYFASNIRATINRLSQNGLEPLSILKELNNFCVAQLGGTFESPGRDFNYKAYGVFDAYNNLYILALEETPTLAAKTLVWNEQRNGFETFLSYAPEMMSCLNQLLITWKDGQLYTHDSATYNNFYGVQYDSSITPVLNDSRLEKKTWMNVTELASTVWDMPEIITQLNSYASTPQTSLLNEQNFSELEGQFHAVFRQDGMSPAGINDGDSLKGTYMIAKFRAIQPTDFTYLDTIAVQYAPSHKSPMK